MKNHKFKSVFFIIILLVISISSCKKDEEKTTTPKTTGNVKVLIKIPWSWCTEDPDYGIPITVKRIKLKVDGSSSILKQIENVPNNAVYDLGELNPGTYTIDVWAVYTKTTGSEGNCTGGVTYKVFQVTANIDQTILIGE